MYQSIFVLNVSGHICLDYLSPVSEHICLERIGAYLSEFFSPAYRGIFVLGVAEHICLERIRAPQFFVGFVSTLGLMVKVRPLFLGPTPFSNTYWTENSCQTGAVELHEKSRYMRMWLPSGHDSFYQQDFWHRICHGGKTVAARGLLLQFSSSEWNRSQTGQPHVFNRIAVLYGYRDGRVEITQGGTRLRIGNEWA